MEADSSSYLLGLLIGGVTLVSLVAIVGGLLHARRTRMLSHAERMKALEMGHGIPEDPATAQVKAAYEASAETSYAGKCFSTVGHACFWGFLFAIGAASRDGGNAPGAAYAIAAAAGAIGVTGLICGTVLAMKGPPMIRPEAGPPAKPRYQHEEV